MTDEQTPPRKSGVIGVVKSVLASFFGVQSERNRQRDFQQGNPAQFLVIGLIATLVFVLVMWGVVSLILNLAS